MPAMLAGGVLVVMLWPRQRIAVAGLRVWMMGLMLEALGRVLVSAASGAERVWVWAVTVMSASGLVLVVMLWPRQRIAVAGLRVWMMGLMLEALGRLWGRRLWGSGALMLMVMVWPTIGWWLLLVTTRGGGVVVEGVCGLPGPWCEREFSDDPLTAGGRLYSSGRSFWESWVGRVLDMCDDHEALFAMFGGTASLADPLDSRDMELVAKERRFRTIVCSEQEAATPRWSCWDGGLAELRAYLEGFEVPPEPSAVLAWSDSRGLDCHDVAAERRRYVYVTQDGPMWPQASVEAAVEAYLAVRSDGPWNLVRLGSRSLEFTVEPSDELFVERSWVSVIDGVVRGLAWNNSERLWARDVVVTAADPSGARGSWRFALAVQPGESFPFEIENWTGSDDPAEISFEVSADLSPRIDLTRSLDFDMGGWTPYHIWKGSAETCNELTFGEIPDAEAIPDMEFDWEAWEPGGEFDLWEVDVVIREPWSHPNLAKAARDQTIEYLVAYGVSFNDDGALTDVFEMTPYGRDPNTLDCFEDRTVRLHQSAAFMVVGFRPAMWVGGVVQPADPG